MSSTVATAVRLLPFLAASSVAALRSEVPSSCLRPPAAAPIAFVANDNSPSPRSRRRAGTPAFRPATSSRNAVPDGDVRSAAVSDLPPSFDVPPLPPLQTSSSAPLPVLPNGGKLTLVGSGPGDPDLLTVSAHRLLTDVDPSIETLVVVDRLVSPEIVSLCDPAAEVRVARKIPGCQHEAQEEIYRWCHAALEEGKHVIRLKIGDPFVFGRGGEEVLAFRSFGLEPTVIPGVSAAFSAPLLGSIPVTHRGVSNRVVMCTGYGKDGAAPSLVPYHREQTVVFLMAVGRMRDLAERMVRAAGYPPDTPVGIVEKAGCPGQRTTVGTLETIGGLAERREVKPPATIVVGEVVNVLLGKDEATGEDGAGLIQDITASAEVV